LILLLNGGWSGLVIGFLAGTGAAAIALGRVPWHTPAEAIRAAGSASAAAGAILFAASLFRDALLVSWAGLPPVPGGQMIPAAVGAFVLATLAGVVFGGLEALPSPARRWARAVFYGACLILYPYIDRALGIGWIGQLIAVLIFVLLGLGLNIVVGFAGLLDLGYAAFFAIGAYTTGLLDSPQLGIHWNFWLVIWLAAAVAAIFGVILGAPTLPLRGDYLAIVTLGFGEIVPIVFRNLTAVTIKEPITNLLAGLANRPELAICLLGCGKAINLTAGEQGVNPIGRPYLPVVGEFRAGVYEPWFYLIISLIALSVFFINRMHRSRLGRAWTAIREDELAASAMGIDLVKTKLLAFAMGATFSGFAGAFFAAYISAIFPSTFDFTISVIVLCMVILGGLGNMAGIILGALLIQSADRLFLPQFAGLLKGLLTTSVYPHVPNAVLRDFLATSLDPVQLRLLLFGLTLVLMMLLRPEGLVPNVRRRAELRADEEPGAGLDDASRQPPTPSEAASPSPAIV
jgi:branched-chain amino acid transport system permease protein